MTGSGIEASTELLIAQALFTVAVALVAYYLARQRVKTVSERREEAMFASLQLANRTLPHLRRGLNLETGQRTAEILFRYFEPAAVGIVAGHRVVGYVGAGADHHRDGPVPGVIEAVLASGRPSVARSPEEIGCARDDCRLGSAVVAPLRSRSGLYGALAVYYQVGQPLSAGRVKVITVLAQLMSVQMELAELDRKTEQLAKAELAALQAQISPHFVYNTLNTIASFIRTKPDEARDLLTQFADFLRLAFRRRGEFARFAEELEYVHQYLGFEQARFGERLSVVYRVDPEILATPVPVLVLQPLVENAIRHGVGRKEGPGRVVIQAEDRGDECWISVQDNGVGMAAEEARRLLGGADARRRDGLSGGLGLKNVHDRLRSVYGADRGLRIESTPGEGTRVGFAVPKFRPGVAATPLAVERSAR
jgi:two-component system LytT family sensor kinase